MFMTEFKASLSLENLSLLFVQAELSQNPVLKLLIKFHSIPANEADATATVNV